MKTSVAAVVLAGILLAPFAHAHDAGVGAAKLVVVDRLAANGTARVIFVSQDAGAHRGAAGSPGGLAGRVDVFYADQPANAVTYLLPSGGWETNDSDKARYRNGDAPTGGGAKFVLVRDGRLAKVVGRSLGDTGSIGLGSPPGPGGVMVVVTIDNTNDGVTHRLCTLFPNEAGQIDLRLTGGGTVRRLRARDGIAAPCPEAVSEPVSGSGTATTDTEGDGATSSDPLETAVTIADAGVVDIVEGPPAGAAPAGFQLVGQQAEITAPASGSSEPLTIVFLLDLSVLLPGRDPSTVELFRDGVPVAACAGEPLVAYPDPCRAERTVIGDDLRITVLSGHASRWTFGLPLCGNGVVDVGEACDPAAPPPQCGGGDACKSSCTCAAPCGCCAGGAATFDFIVNNGAGVCGVATQSDGSPFADLDCNGLYFGGGQGSVALPGRFVYVSHVALGITSCADERLTLVASSAAQTGSVGTCSSLGCLFGPPIPLPNEVSTPVSTCLRFRFAQDAGGTATCDGSALMNLPLAADVYLTGDAVPAESGTQPCPICIGPPGAETCRGGPSDGSACVPQSADLGDAYPTSHDCGLSPSLLVGSFSIGATLTTGPAAVTARSGAFQPNVFCGFCRDLDATGGFGLCSDGSACAGAIDCSAGPCGGARACEADADCAGDPRETCEQRNSGAFGPAGGSVRTIALAGSPAACLADGIPHAMTLVGGACVEPTFNAIIDAAADLPGPAALSLQGATSLVPPGGTTTTIAPPVSTTTSTFLATTTSTTFGSVTTTLVATTTSTTFGSVTTTLVVTTTSTTFGSVTTTLVATTTSTTFGSVTTTLVATTTSTTLGVPSTTTTTVP